MENWERRFRDEFQCTAKNCCNGTRTKDQFTPEEYINFFKQTLSSEKQRVVAGVKTIGLKIRCGKCDGGKDLVHTLACQTISDVLKLLEEGDY